MYVIKKITKYGKLRAMIDIKQILKLTANITKQARLSQNLSIEELSKLSKVSVYKIKKIETGNYNFQLKEFNKLSKYLDIKLILKKR